MTSMRLRFWLRRSMITLFFVVVLAGLAAVLSLMGVTGWTAEIAFWGTAFGGAAAIFCLLLDVVILYVHETDMRHTAAYGTRAKATVLKVERTGAITEHVGEYVGFRLEVHPPHSWPPFQVELFEVIYYHIYDLVPGKIVDVVFDPGTKFVVIPDMQLPIPRGYT